MTFAIILAFIAVLVVSFLHKERPEEVFPLPPKVVVHQPKHCCLVKGVLKSLADTPDSWTIEIGVSPTRHSLNFIAKHTESTTKVTTEKNYDIWPYPDLTPLPTATIEYYDCTPQEAACIYSAINYERDRRHKKSLLDALEKARIEAAPRIEYFEAIGCPKSE